jgi:hypothetical protein
LYSGGDSVGVQEDTDGLSVMTMVIFLHSVHTRGEGEEGSKASTTEVDEVADRFQREILLVSTLSGTVSSRGT